MARTRNHDGSRTSIERRRSERRSVHGRASVLCSGRSFEAEAVDISESGVCLTSPVALYPGTSCRLTMEVHPAPLMRICVSGSVCFCIEQRGQYRVGVHCSESADLVAAVRRGEAHQIG